MLEGRSLLSIAPVKPEVSSRMNTDPTRAVPNEEPRFWNVPCRPPTSEVSAALTADMLTFPSWEARRPKPEPTMNMPIAKITPARSGCTAANTRSTPSASTPWPHRAIWRGDRTVDRREPTTEKRISPSESGRIRRPVCRAS